MAKETPQEIEHIWRAPDGTIVGQDPRYDNEMTNQGYVPATDAEADDFVARSKGAAREAYEAPETPERPSANVPPGTSVEPPVDTALVKKIKDSAASVGMPVSDEEALQRARNVARLTADQPNYPVARQGDVNEFSDFPSQVGTALEGVAGGLSLGILPFVEGLIGDFAEELGAVDNPITSANIQRRKEANPTISLVSDVGSSLTQGGLSVLKTAAPLTFSKLPGFVKAIQKLDVAGRVGEGVQARTSAVAAGTTFGKQKAATKLEIEGLKQRFIDAQTEAARINAATVAAGGTPDPRLAATLVNEALTKVEQQVLGLQQEVSKVGALDKVNAAVRSITPGITKKTAQELATQRSIDERAMFVIQEKLASQFESAGYSSQVAKLLAQGAIGAPAGATAGATAGFIRGGADKALQLNAATKEQVEAAGDSVSAAALRGGGRGLLTGGALAVAAPVAFTGLSAGLNAVSQGLKFLTRTVGPRVGGFLQKEVGPEEIDIAIQGADLAANSDFRREADALVDALQYQYDNAQAYFSHLQDVDNQIGNIGTAAYTAARGAPPSPPPFILGGGPLEQKFMKRLSSGRMVYDKTKVREALMKQAIQSQRNPTTGRFEPTIKLPPEIEQLQQGIGQFEEAIRIAVMANNPSELGRVSALLQSGRPALGESIFPAKGAAAVFGEIATGRPTQLFDPLTEGFTVGPFSPVLKGMRAERLVQEVGKPIGGLSQTTEAGILTFLGTQLAGFSPAEAGVAAVGLQQLKNLLVNPATSIQNYELLQTLIQRSDGATLNLARFLTNSGASKATAVRALQGLKPVDEVLVGGVKEPRKIQMTDAAARQLYDADRELLGKLGGADAAGNIDDVFGGDYDALDAAYPVLAQNLMGTIPRQVAFLNEKMKAIPADREPTRQELFTYGLYSRYTRDPDLIYTDIAEKNYLPSQALEVMEKVYPASLQRLRTQLFEQLVDAAERKERIPAKQQTIIDTILGKKTGGLSAEQIKNIQGSMPVPTGKAGPISTKLPQLEREGLPR